MQTKEKCKNCNKAFPIGVDVFGKPKYGCKNIFCIFEKVVENPYHEISIRGIPNGGKNT